MSPTNTYKVVFKLKRDVDKYTAVAHATGMMKEMRRDSYVEQVLHTDLYGNVVMIVKTSRMPTPGPEIDTVEVIYEDED